VRKQLRFGFAFAVALAGCHSAPSFSGNWSAQAGVTPVAGFITTDGFTTVSSRIIMNDDHTVNIDEYGSYRPRSIDASADAGANPLADSVEVSVSGTWKVNDRYLIITMNSFRFTPSSPRAQQLEAELDKVKGVPYNSQYQWVSNDEFMILRSGRTQAFDRMDHVQQ
jgi:hypothetical protein